MLEWLKEFQLSFMLFLSGACGVLALLSLSTRTISRHRKHALVFMEFEAMLLLLADRMAYMYRGDESTTGYYVVRISNLLVFSLSLFVIHSFNIYLMDLYRKSEKVGKIPRSLILCEVLFTLGQILLMISQFTGLYYTYDEHNNYQRAPGFVLSYVFPLLIMLIELITIIRYRRVFDNMVFVPVVMFSLIPFAACFIQFYTYGLSLINMSMVGMCVALYFFEIINLNKMQEAKSAAERASNAKSRFLANMSHEIRTPINTIMGMDEMIIREIPEGVPKPYYMSVVGYAYDIKAAAETLLSLINDILDISKIESGKMNLVEQEYDISQQIQNIVTMIKVRSKQKNLDFSVDIDENIPRMLYGDQGKIKQIVLNLLTNAVKYTDIGGFKLSVTMPEKDGDSCKLRFSVKDTGIGVKEEDMDKLFSAFDRLDERKNSGIQGTGLGLHISKQFSDLMGGKIWCESSYGKGSDFIFEVRQKIISDEPIGVFKEEGSLHIRGPYIPKFVAPDVKVLIVDDSEMNLKVIEGLLRATKMQIVTALSGKAGIELIKKTAFDLVILDHMMPEMDGVEALKIIREEGFEMPVLALTANYFADAEEVYKSYGFDGYIPKPVDGKLLETVIRNCLPKEKVVDQEFESVFGLSERDLPENMTWLKNVDSIDMEEGIKNSGGAFLLAFSLKMFYDTIDDHCKVLEKAIEDKDYKLYTVKVHALKASAKIVGAMKLSKMAAELEKAGKNADYDYIAGNHKALIEEYRAYSDRLSRFDSVDFSEHVPPMEGEISAVDLKESYLAIGRFAKEMDYDAIDVLIRKLKEYTMPSEDQKIISDIEKALKLFDWKRIEELVK